MSTSHDSFIKSYIKNNVYRASLKSYFSGWFKLLAILAITMITCSLLESVNPFLFALYVPQLIIVFGKVGVEINLNNQTYRCGLRLGNFQFGKWRKMNQIDHLEILARKISLRSLKLNKWIPSWISSPNFAMNIVFEDGSSLALLSSNQIGILHLISNRLSKYLKAFVIDKTTDSIPSLFIE